MLLYSNRRSIITIANSRCYVFLLNKHPFFNVTLTLRHPKTKTVLFVRQNKDGCLFRLIVADRFESVHVSYWGKYSLCREKKKKVP